MPSRPARRAGLLMIAIGVLLLVISVVVTLFMLLRPEWVDEQMAENRRLLQDSPLLERPTLTYTIAIAGGLGVLESGLSVLLGVMILRGRRWAAVSSISLTVLRLIIVGLYVLICGLGLVLTLVLSPADLKAAGDSLSVGSIAIDTALGAAAGAVLVVLLVWLVKALRSPLPAERLG